MLDFTGKIALVTGCGSADDGWTIGKAIATLLARQGARVIGTDLSEDALATTARQAASEGLVIETMVCDATKRAAVADCVAKVLERHGRIDVLVNNVGLSRPGSVVGIAEADWDAQFDVNLKSAFLMCQAVLPSMDERRSGCVVNMSSISALRYSGKDQIAYATSKAALIQFTRMAAQMHGKTGVRINCVVPGLVTTPLVHRLARQFGGGDTEAYIQQRLDKVPLAREGTAWDVANAVAFLASDEAGFITGTDLIVDGGSASTMR